MISYSKDTAIIEASRCLMCHDAPCHKGCPATVDPRRFIRKIRFEDFSGAVKMLRETNILAASCAYICPCYATCMSECTSEKVGESIDISGLQRFIMNWEIENGMVEPEKAKLNGKKVAVIGSGPAGLSCAAKLAAKGYQVEIFEAEDKAGGQLRLSIPDFRLPRAVIDFEVEFVKKLGVKINLKSSVFDLKKLKAGFDAVYVAAGLMGSKKMGVKGENTKGVYDALDYLIRSKRGEKISLGRRVLVVGGGDTAIDAARVAAGNGAQALLLYRRTRKEMPAYRIDVERAFNEGVEMWFRVLPVEVAGKTKVEGLKVKRVSWKGRGRTAKEYDVEGPEFIIKADSIINAIGQERAAKFNQKEKGVFFGGDFANGAGTAVAAVADGAKAADEIDKFLNRGSSQACSYYSAPKADLSVTFCGVKFENPFVLAAAPPTDDLDMVRKGLASGWAGAVLKTTSTVSTKVPLKYPMMSGLEYEGRKLSSMGNIDLISEHHIDVVEKRITILKKEFPSKVIIASIMGSNKEEWQGLVKRLSDAGVDMIECSFSCPQGSLGAKPGRMLAQDIELTQKVASWVKEAASSHKRNVPVVIKITPHVADITEVAEAVKKAGCDAVCASNTIQSLMGINIESFVPYPNVEGKSAYSGMSGPAIKPITLKVISEIA
ncbi:MAG: FAD-dependent oxidoreductase, partial [Deltaproteobacteria bacterium]|nr:FAD-dependent oxidoreductase [Deltaproteobacteria bacterium]